MIESLTTNFHYLISIVLFLIGLYTMLTHSNLIKKIMGMNIMETAVFLLIISMGYVSGGRAQLAGGEVVTNPLPSALILTGIVIAVSATAFALNLIVALYRRYGTLDADKLARIRMMGQ